MTCSAPCIVRTYGSRKALGIQYSWRPCKGRAIGVAYGRWYCLAHGRKIEGWKR